MMDHIIKLDPTISLGAILSLMVTIFTLIFALGKFWQETKEISKQLAEFRAEFNKHVEVDRDCFEQLHDQVLRIVLNPHQPLLDRMAILERRIENVIPIARVTVSAVPEAGPEPEHK